MSITSYQGGFFDETHKDFKRREPFKDAWKGRLRRMSDFLSVSVQNVLHGGESKVRKGKEITGAAAVSEKFETAV